MLLGVVDDRALEVRGEDVAHDADGQVGLLEDQVRAPWSPSTRLPSDLVELEQVLHLALEVLALGAVGRGADDRAAAAEVELGGLLAQPRALLVLQAARHADALAGGRVDHVAAGDRELHRQPRALGLQRVLDDLADDLLAGLEQVGDRRALGAAAALHRLDARQDDLVDVQEAVLVQADVDERRLQARAGRCRRRPCRCCRRWTGCRGARGRPRPRGSPWRAQARRGGGGRAARCRWVRPWRPPGSRRGSPPGPP